MKFVSRKSLPFFLWNSSLEDGKRQTLFVVSKKLSRREAWEIVERSPMVERFFSVPERVKWWNAILRHKSYWYFIVSESNF